MKIILITVILMVLIANLESFQDPQGYVVHMYHHQRLTLTQKGEAKQYGQFYLTATNEKHQIYNGFKKPRGSLHLKKRRKRQQESENRQDPTEFDNDQQYQSFETNGDNNETYEYDYDMFKNEYYNEVSTGLPTAGTTNYEDYDESQRSTPENIEHPKQRSNDTKGPDTPMENYCSVLLLFRIRVIQCFWFGWIHNKKDIKENAGWVLYFWLVMYASTALYLWCSKGWCCCCCQCAICQPRRVIQEAKEFLARNPPGSATLAQGDTINYCPNDLEVQCYTDMQNDVFNV